MYMCARVLSQEGRRKCECFLSWCATLLHYCKALKIDEFTKPVVFVGNKCENKGEETKSSTRAKTLLFGVGGYILWYLGFKIRTPKDGSTSCKTYFRIKRVPFLFIISRARRWVWDYLRTVFELIVSECLLCVRCPGKQVDCCAFLYTIRLIFR